jgi:hypothetical protein
MRQESRNCPDNPERIAEYQERYAAILRDQRPDSSEQLRAAFLEQMKGREYGEGPLLSAFAWFWNGWAASSGAHAAASEKQDTIEECKKVLDELYTKGPARGNVPWAQAWSSGVLDAHEAISSLKGKT